MNEALRKTSAAQRNMLHVLAVTVHTFVLMYVHYHILLSICWWQLYSVMDAHCCTFTGRGPLSAEQPGSSRRLMDVKIHYMHHSLNTALPFTRTPFRPYIGGYCLQHVITVIGSLWRDPAWSVHRKDVEGLWSSESMSEEIIVGRFIVVWWVIHGKATRRETPGISLFIPTVCSIQ